MNTILSHVRKPAVAGMFYPADGDKLRADIDEYLAQARPTTARPKAIIAPHAGYIYSGPVAASAYAAVKNVREFVNRVVLLGPAHRVPFEGLATTTKEAFETPLGIIPVDTEAVATTLTFPQVQAFDAADRSEHSLEVHLPFLQRVLQDFKLVPFVVGNATPQQVGEVLDALWGGDETLIVISSDLSHYHDYATARRLDRDTATAIEALDVRRIHSERACGCTPIRGLLDCAPRHRLHGHLLDLRNSGDTAGPRDQVVGYGAFVFEEAHAG